MPSAAFGFDGDNAAYEALKAKVLQDEEARKRKDNNIANKKLVGESSDRSAPSANDARRRKSFGERVANTLFNGGRPDDVEGWRDLKTKVQQRKQDKD